ncbi:MFS transporter [Hortaea werneckii]|nr:MFS transporter [Hortaea werneckii]KAI7313725.1 MFS transporter [Hortaea werneckii]
MESNKDESVAQVEMTADGAAAEVLKEGLAADEETAKYAAGGVELDPATSKKLYWKVCGRILPFMLVTYFFQSLDKGTIGLSSIMGIIDDADLHGSQYNWLGTILYIGILAGEYPQNFLLQKLPVAKFLAANVFLWGAVVACSAACTKFRTLMVVRFFLGLFESCVQPTFVIIQSMWFTREEQSVLTSLWYCQMGVSVMFGGLIAYGTSHYGGNLMYSWQLLFLVLGLATVVWAFAIAFFLPDNPMRAKCFTEDEKRLLIERVRKNETGIQNKEYKRYQVVEALTDLLVWCSIALILVANLVIGGLGVFSNLIISNFGFSTLQTQLLNIAQGAVTICVMVGSAWVSQKWNQTFYTMLLWTIPPVIGTGIILGVEPTPSRAGGMLIAFYCTQFFLAQGNMIISLVSRNVAGRTKKGVVLTGLFIGWAVGNLIAPQIFQQTDAPRYTTGFVVHLVVYGVYVCLVVMTRLLLMRRNRQKDAMAGNDGITHDLAFQDLTDKENPNFRYVY